LSENGHQKASKTSLKTGKIQGTGKGNQHEKEPAKRRSQRKVETMCRKDKFNTLVIGTAGTSTWRHFENFC